MDSALHTMREAVKGYIRLEEESGVADCFFRPGVSAPAGTAIRTGDGWEALKTELRSCVKCDLHKTRLNVVFGAGNPRAELVFIGEAPGEDEDIQGLPFVGRAGQLLTKIIEAMGLTRADVYIANILKCRPPNNRPPLPTEIVACVGNVRRQLELIGPKAICTLGKFASQTLLGSETPISALRGKWHDLGGVPVMPTFHPAYLLRNPDDKKLVWGDMKKVMALLRSA